MWTNIDVHDRIDGDLGQNYVVHVKSKHFVTAIVLKLDLETFSKRFMCVREFVNYNENINQICLYSN